MVDPASDPRCGGRGARLGRGVRRHRDRRPGGGRADDPGRRPRGHPAALLGRDRRHQGARQDRHRVRQAGRDVPADPGELVRGDGPSADQGPVGHRLRGSPSDWPASASDRPPAGRDARGAAGRGVRSQHRAAHRPTRVEASAATDVDDTPWVARAHGRETTYQQNLEPPPTRSTTRSGRWPRQVVEDIRAEGRECLRVHLKVRFAPFFTVNRSRKLPEPTFDAGRDRRRRARPAPRAGGRPADPAARRTRRDGASRGRLRRPADAWAPRGIA